MKSRLYFLNDDASEEKVKKKKKLRWQNDPLAKDADEIWRGLISTSYPPSKPARVNKKGILQS